MSTVSPPALLDASTFAARSELRDLGVPDPALLVLAGTGRPMWSGDVPHEAAGFKRHGSIELQAVRALPGAWSEGELVFGSVETPAGPATAWVLEDVGLELAPGHDRPAFEAALPVWIAAAAGATVLLHTAAGGALAGAELEPGDLCVVEDYLNLSGSTPLLGVGESKLGPLFPDLSRLFAPGLLRAATQHAGQLGITANTGIAAASAPVALATPAERSWFRAAGADVWAQGLQAPYLAAAHAGLDVLALLAVIDTDTDLDPSVDVQRLITRSESTAAALDDLLAHVLPAAAEHALSAQESA